MPKAACDCKGVLFLVFQSPLELLLDSFIDPFALGSLALIVPLKDGHVSFMKGWRAVEVLKSAHQGAVGRMVVHKINGATEELCTNTTRRLNKTRIIIIGASQYFFLTLKKSQNSLKIDIFDMFLSLMVSKSERSEGCVEPLELS